MCSPRSCWRVVVSSSPYRTAYYPPVVPAEIVFWQAVKDKAEDLQRRLKLARAGYKHDRCGLCGMEWSVDYYCPVNSHGDCRACANEQYGH